MPARSSAGTSREMMNHKRERPLRAPIAGKPGSFTYASAAVTRARTASTTKDTSNDARAIAAIIRQSRLYSCVTAVGRLHALDHSRETRHPRAGRAGAPRRGRRLELLARPACRPRAVAGGAPRGGALQRASARRPALGAHREPPD